MGFDAFDAARGAHRGFSSTGNRVSACHELYWASHPMVPCRRHFTGHPADDLRVPHVPPGRAGRGTEVQHGREHHICVTRLPQRLKIAPSPNGRETPGLEPLQSDFSPPVRISVMPPGRIAGIIEIELIARSTHVHHTNAQGKEPFTVRPDQPKVPIPPLNRKWLFNRGRFGGRRPNALAAIGSHCLASDSR